MMRRALLFASMCLAAGCTERAPSLINESLIIGDRIPSPLTETAGDIENGRAIFTARETGHCVLCHQVATIDAPFQGNLGPSLDNVGSRLDAGQLRLRIVDYQRVRPGTVMPSYYRTNDLYQVGADYVGKPVLSRRQVEDLVAYLESLKE